MPLTAASQTNRIDAKLAGIRQQLAKTAGARSIILRAPEAGTVSTMVVDPGQAVQAGESVISVMPAGSMLRAQLLVPSRLIGFIRPGSRLNLRYAAFPYQEFGQYQGIVTSISRSALTPTQVAELTQERTKKPLYRVMGEPTRKYLRCTPDMNAARTFVRFPVRKLPCPCSHWLARFSDILETVR